MNVENETLKWPTTMDHAAKVERLFEAHATALVAGQLDLAARLEMVALNLENLR